MTLELKSKYATYTDNEQGQKGKKRPIDPYAQLKENNNNPSNSAKQFKLLGKSAPYANGHEFKRETQIPFYPTSMKERSNSSTHPQRMKEKQKKKKELTGQVG